MRRPLVAGNWKMHGSRARARELAAQVAAGRAGAGVTELLICPPSVHLVDAAAALAGSDVALGAQNVCDRDQGAATGEVSGDMLRELGCGYAIVGHSERRRDYAESDQLVAARLEGALRHGLTPILCLGETLEEREAGATEAVLARQLTAVLDRVGGPLLGKAVLAYEPVWAIGTGRTATPEQAQLVHAYLRARMADVDRELADALRILYGGSVKASNAAELFAQPDIDGGLVGGASLEAGEFLAIARAAGA